jgi:hypothetical protein
MLRSMLFGNNTGGAVATMTVDLAPDYIEESFIPNGGWTSGTVVPTPTGGTSPYTYNWFRPAGGGNISLVYSPSTKDMAFYASGTNQRFYSQWICTVTDSASPANTASAMLVIAVGFNVSAYPEGSEPF